MPECIAQLFQVTFITWPSQHAPLVNTLDRTTYRPLLERADGDRKDATNTLIDELPRKSPGIFKAFTIPVLREALVDRLLDLLAQEANRARECESHFSQCIAKSSAFYRSTNTRFAELSTATMLESARDLERRTVLDPRKTPFNPASKAVLAWPFFLYNVIRGEKESVTFTLTPAVSPVTIDNANGTVLSFSIESGSVGIEQGVNRFGGPASRLVNNSSTNVISSRTPQSSWATWMPLWDGQSARGVDDNTTWFWVIAETGKPLDTDELSQMLKAKGGPSRVELSLITPTRQQAERSFLLPMPSQNDNFRYFSENTKTFFVEEGHERFSEVFARLKEGVKEWTAITSDVERTVQSQPTARQPDQTPRPAVQGEINPTDLRHTHNRDTGPSVNQKHDIVFDLRDNNHQHAKEIRNAKVFQEADGTTYWGPVSANKMAEIVYELPLPGRLAKITSTMRVVAYNRNHESGIVFDPECGATLDVSVDGKTWLEIQRNVAGEPLTNYDISAVQELRGTTKIFFRARVKVSRASRDGIRYAQFLRGNPSKGELPTIECVVE
jgi:hypothetical protein